MDTKKPSHAGEVANRREVLELLTAAARRGHVPAIRLLLSEIERGGVDEAATIVDQLARRRGREDPARG